MKYRKRTKEQIDLLTHDLETYLKQHPDEKRHLIEELSRYHRKKNGMEQEPRLYKTWEVSAFNPKTEEWTTAVNHGYEYTPDVENAFISQAPPVEITPIKHRSRPRRNDTVTVLGGDAQIGFRAGEPFHDERALALFQIAVQELRPDNVVFTGDMIDLTAQSRWTQREDWVQETQNSLDRYSKFLADTRSNAGEKAKIVVVHGNHEARLDNYIRGNAQAVLNLRRANTHELAVLTLQYLVRYDEIGIEAVDGYPNAAYWLEDNLKVTHGTNTKKGGSNAAKYLAEETESVIYGHTHRIELAYRSRATRVGASVIAAASPGCLCRVDGGVPGFHYSVDNRGNTVPKAEDWQQGLLIVRHTPEYHDITPVRFNASPDNATLTMRLNGKEWTL